MNQANGIALERVKDPVCGMDVDPAKTAHRVEHEGNTYYFCCGGCAQKFRNDPGAFLKKAGAAERGAAAKAEKYICPMCPGIESTRPAA